MPLNVSNRRKQTKSVSKKYDGGESLNLSYLTHRFSSAEQADFEDTFNAADKLCGNEECRAKLPLEELTETERAQKRAAGQANGHAMLERSVTCDKCGEIARPRRKQAEILSKYLADVMTEVDWTDDDGAIPIEQEAILERIDFELMMEAFTMIQGDKSGKGSRAR